ncbi:transposase [Actinacidiphila glaucinigra]|uniref:transposase n=1 Tax=Actinacidiphila glaucinigra TaxID=235986 RepID=UPI0033A99F03
MRAWTTARDWLTVFQLPAYAPDLNPVEGIWSSLRRTSLTNIAFTDYTQLVSAVRQGLRQIPVLAHHHHRLPHRHRRRHKSRRHHVLILSSNVLATR